MGRPKKLPKSYVRWVTEKEQKDLTTLGQQISEAEWLIGDLALALFQREKELAGVKRTGELIKAVGIFAGLKAKAVRQLLRVSASFDQGWRQEYSALSWEYFSRALRFSPNDPRKILDWCMAYREQNGYIPTLDALDVGLGKGASRAVSMADDELDTPNAVRRDQGIRRRKTRYAAKEVITAIRENQLDLGPDIDAVAAISILEQFRDLIVPKEGNSEDSNQDPTDRNGKVLPGASGNHHNGA